MHLPSDSDNKGNSGLGGHVEVVLFSGLASEPDGIPLFHPVLLDILLGPLENHLPLFTSFLKMSERYAEQN